MSKISNFLIVFDRAKNQLVELTSFDGDLAAANEAYAAAERTHRGNPAIDVVLLGSDSLETIKVTHSNYFEGNAERRIEDALNF